MVTYKQFVTRITQLLDNNLDNNLYNNLVNNLDKDLDNNLGNILDNSLVLGPLPGIDDYFHDFTTPH